MTPLQYFERWILVIGLCFVGLYWVVKLAILSAMVQFASSRVIG